MDSRLLSNIWKFANFLIFSCTTFIDFSEAQFNIYGVNLKLVKMRFNSGDYLQQYEMQVDYTHSNKVVDYGVVTVSGVQDHTDLIFVEAMNRNPFHLPKVEVQGDVCFRLFVQNGDVLFTECLKIRDLPSSSAYYSSKYVTRTKREGSVLMYQLVQFMVENRDRTRDLLERSFIDAQLGKLAPACPCTVSIILASFQGALLLLLGLLFVYWKFGKFKLAKKSSQNNSQCSLSPSLKVANGGIYAENAISTSSIACYAPPQISRVEGAPEPAERPVTKTVSPYHVTSKMASLPPQNGGNNLNGTMNTASTNNNHSPHPRTAEESPGARVASRSSPAPEKIENQGTGDAKRLRKSIIEQILSKKFSKTPTVEQYKTTAATKNQNSDKKGGIKSSNDSPRKKTPPSPPPPDYKNYGFSDSDDENEDGQFYGAENVKPTGFDHGRIYDRLESPKS